MNKTFKELQKECEEWLKTTESFQSDFDWRLKIFEYCFADIVRWNVYSLYYGENNPRKSSLKSDLGDACIQFALLVVSMGGDLEEMFNFGLERIQERCYEQKAIKNLPEELKNKMLEVSNKIIKENLNRRYKK